MAGKAPGFREGHLDNILSQRLERPRRVCSQSAERRAQSRGLSKITRQSHHWGSCTRPACGDVHTYKCDLYFLKLEENASRSWVQVQQKTLNFRRLAHQAASPVIITYNTRRKSDKPKENMQFCKTGSVFADQCNLDTLKSESEEGMRTITGSRCSTLGVSPADSGAPWAAETTLLNTVQSARCVMKKRFDFIGFPGGHSVTLPSVVRSSAQFTVRAIDMQSSTVEPHNEGRFNRHHHIGCSD